MKKDERSIMTYERDLVSGKYSLYCHFDAHTNGVLYYRFELKNNQKSKERPNGVGFFKDSSELGCMVANILNQYLSRHGIKERVTKDDIEMFSSAL